MSRSPAISICLHRLGQVEQAQQVAGGAARAAHGLRGLLVREPELVHQALQALRLFQRVEVLALDVLDQRHHGGGLVGHLAHQHRHLVQPGQARGAEAALAGDDFVARAGAGGRAHGPHQDRLHHALALDALGQLVERALVHARARLVLAGLQLGELEHGGRALVACGRWRVADLGAEQRFQAEAEALGFLGRCRPAPRPACRQCDAA
jgi:hypothetical protein